MCILDQNQMRSTPERESIPARRVDSCTLRSKLPLWPSNKRTVLNLVRKAKGCRILTRRIKRKRGTHHLDKPRRLEPTGAAGIGIRFVFFRQERAPPRPSTGKQSASTASECQPRHGAKARVYAASTGSAQLLSDVRRRNLLVEVRRVDRAGSWYLYGVDYGPLDDRPASTVCGPWRNPRCRVHAG